MLPVIALQSEDSDYTSDINFPMQHQHNSSAHQFGSSHQYGTAQQYVVSEGHSTYATNHSQYVDTRDDAVDSTNQFYGRNDSLEHGDSFDCGQQVNGQVIDRYGYYEGQHQEIPYYVGFRSDTESEPMSYNSRPMSSYNASER